MPNVSYCQLSINLPEVEFYEDGVGCQAMRQNRWDLMKKLRDELDVDDWGSLDFLTILRPEPKDIGDDWYQWRNANWGTKWGRLIDLQLEPDLHLGQFTLETAWAPPIDLCQYLTNELGFEVRCVWSSYDNQDWGVWEDGDISGHHQVKEYLEEDDYEELRDLIEDCEDDESKLNKMIDLCVFDGRGDQLEEHDREWIISEWECVFSTCLEKYEEWVEEQPERLSLLKMKQQLLERGEELLEYGRINEGDYLKLCNDLGKGTRERIKDLRDMIEPIVDNYSIDYPQDQMIDYYKTGEEPKLIECYY
mgnify:FL=1